MITVIRSALDCGYGSVQGRTDAAHDVDLVTSGVTDVGL